MALHHSEDTHRKLVERIPDSTGRQITEWFVMLEAGPGLSRFDERVN